MLMEEFDEKIMIKGNSFFCKFISMGSPLLRIWCVGI